MLPGKRNFKTTVSMGKVMAANLWSIHGMILIDLVSCDVMMTTVPSWAC